MIRIYSVSIGLYIVFFFRLVTKVIAIIIREANYITKLYYLPLLNN